MYSANVEFVDILNCMVVKNIFSRQQVKYFGCKLLVDRFNVLKLALIFYVWIFINIPLSGLIYLQEDKQMAQICIQLSKN